MKKITAAQSQPLHIGMQGEHLACEVVFPEAAHWREEYGDGVFSLWHKRPNETAAYPCVLREENGEIVLIDYKTDSCSDIKELEEKYSEQLKWYKYAIEKILNKKVSETYIYSFHKNDFLKLKWSEDNDV